jgi:hypothetical protein
MKTSKPKKSVHINHTVIIDDSTSDDTEIYSGDYKESNVIPKALNISICSMLVKDTAEKVEDSDNSTLDEDTVGSDNEVKDTADATQIMHSMGIMRIKLEAIKRWTTLLVAMRILH